MAEWNGGTSNDKFIGGSGNDLMDGHEGHDTMEGGAGNDYYVIDSLFDVVVEGLNQGIDTVITQVTGYTLANNVENLGLANNVAVGTGNALNNVIIGNNANNTLNGGAGNDTLIGGTGNDSYVIDTLADVVTEVAGQGTDAVTASISGYVLAANVENLVLTGAAAAGTGNVLNNVITGNAANNTLNGGAGNDTLIGGTGNDSYVIDTLADVVTEVAGQGTDAVTASISGYTLAANVENLVLAGTAAAGTGNVLNNVITGNAVNNTLNGDAGNDTLNGDAGNDTLNGGAGNDSYVIDTLADVVTEVAGQGTDAVTASISGYTLAANVENLVLTGTAAAGTGNVLNNVITGNAANNTLDGGLGNDSLLGMTGNDSLIGGLGNDYLIGGSGNDTYVVDSFGDLVIEAANAGTDLIQSSISWSLATNTENLCLVGAAAINATGNATNNYLEGNTSHNRLDGQAGNDILSGGFGNDTYRIDSAGDVVVEFNGRGHDQVQAMVSHTLSSSVEDLVLLGVGSINGTGNSLNNLMIGNSANNVLDGLIGNDTLVGGSGNDTYIIDSAEDMVTEFIWQGHDQVQTEVSHTLSLSVEDLVLSGVWSISGTGNSSNNVITGNLAGNVLDGGIGNDTLVGRSGNDTYIVDSAGDMVTELPEEGHDQVQATVSHTLSSSVEDLALLGAGLNGTGNVLDNVITGNSVNNTLSGNAGNDTLVGGMGNDTIFYKIWDGNDTIIADASTLEASDVIRLGSGIAESNLSATQKDLDLEINIGDTGTLTVTNFYEVGAYTIGSIELADGTTLYLNDEATLDALISTTAIPL